MRFIERENAPEPVWVSNENRQDQVFPVVGVFVVRDGKITEWVDYLDK